MGALSGSPAAQGGVSYLRWPDTPSGGAAAPPPPARTHTGSNQSEMPFKRPKKEFLNSLGVCLEVGTLTSFSAVAAFGTSRKLLQSFSTPLVQGSRSKRIDNRRLEDAVWTGSKRTAARASHLGRCWQRHEASFGSFGARSHLATPPFKPATTRRWRSGSELQVSRILPLWKLKLFKVLLLLLLLPPASAPSSASSPPLCSSSAE